MTYNIVYTFVLFISWLSKHLEINSFEYFGKISFKISPNKNKLDSFKIYEERAVEKWPKLTK